MMDNRIVIPRILQPAILDRIHSGHLGITKCRRLANVTVWWPTINKDIERKLSDCYVITVMESLFGRHGVPNIIREDNGPKFDCSEFKTFAKLWGFEIITSSPRFPQSNGQAESAVHTAKRLIVKCSNWKMGVLSYNSTPLKNGYSPAELLMGRKLRTTVPISPVNLAPKLPNHDELISFERKERKKQKIYFDKRHGAVHDKPDLQVGQKVFVRDIGIEGIIIEKHSSPRSFIVRTQRGSEVRRNKFHLIPLPDHDQQNSSLKPSFSSNQDPHTSRPCRIKKTPNRLNL